MPRGENILARQSIRPRNAITRVPRANATRPPRSEPEPTDTNQLGEDWRRFLKALREGFKPREDPPRRNEDFVAGSDFLSIGKAITGTKILPNEPDLNLDSEEPVDTETAQADALAGRKGSRAPAVSAQAALDQNALNSEMTEAIQVIQESPLDEQSQVAANVIREEIDASQAQVEIDLLRARQELDIQDVLFEQSLKDAGLADEIDLEPLRGAVAKEGGLGAQTLAAIEDIAQDATMTEAEKDEGIDLILTRRHFSKAIAETVTDMVQNTQDLARLESRSDADLLGDTATFLNPDINFDVLGENDAERFQANFLNGVIETMGPEIQAIMAPLPDDDFTVEAWDNLMSFAMFGDFESPGYLQDLEFVSTSWGIPASRLHEEFKAAHKRAVDADEQWNIAEDADSLTPGSESMIAAIYQAGEASGVYTAEFLELVAKSVDLHMLIDVKSKGKSGLSNDGTTRGVGGLTEVMYEMLMGEEWTPKRGMQWELQALLEYIDRQFDGDPVAAIQFYRQTGEWGGSAALNG